MRKSLAGQLESVFSLVDVAIFHGHASFRVEGGSLLKRLECFGMRLDFMNGDVVRLRSRNLDLRILHQNSVSSSVKGSERVAQLPVSGPRLFYDLGTEETLDALYREVGHLAPHQSAA